MAEAGTYLKNVVVGLDIGYLGDLLEFSFVKEEVLSEGAFGGKAFFLQKGFQGVYVIDVGHARRAANFIAAKAEWWSAWFSPAML